jgi:hypothetical protein
MQKHVIVRPLRPWRRCLTEERYRCELDRMHEDFMKLTRLITLGSVWLLLVSLSGCGAMLHELQPHRLWRLNYQPKSGNSDGSYGSYFSIEDRLIPTSKADLDHVSKP